MRCMKASWKVGLCILLGLLVLLAGLKLWLAIVLLGFEMSC